MGETELPISGIRIDYETGSVADINEIWGFDLPRSTHFTAKVTVVSGGNVSVREG
ncbi:hypothetical protein GCM10008022_20630 [Paenibacillus hunanensis]|nr:hypothetical protein GCM10008022_20630 [Paenibacillus hunanensis]